MLTDLEECKPLDACVSLKCPVEAGNIVTLPFSADIDEGYLEMMVNSKDFFYAQGREYLKKRFVIFRAKNSGFNGRFWAFTLTSVCFSLAYHLATLHQTDGMTMDPDARCYLKDLCHHPEKITSLILCNNQMNCAC